MCLNLHIFTFSPPPPLRSPNEALFFFSHFALCVGTKARAEAGARATSLAGLAGSSARRANGFSAICYDGLRRPPASALIAGVPEESFPRPPHGGPAGTTEASPLFSGSASSVFFLWLRFQPTRLDQAWALASSHLQFWWLTWRLLFHSIQMSFRGVQGLEEGLVATAPVPFPRRSSHHLSLFDGSAIPKLSSLVVFL